MSMPNIHIWKSFVQKKSDLGLVLFLGTISFALLAIVTWGLNKGFDFSDEGFYLLGYQHNQEHFIVSTHFHSIVKFFFGFIPLNPINIRILSLIVSIISTVIFTFFVIRSYTILTKTKLNRKHLIITYLFTSIGSFASYILPLRGFSYNTITKSLLLICFGLLFFACAKILIQQNKSILNKLLIVVAGYCLGFLVFVKITSFAAAIIVISISFLILFYQKKNRYATFIIAIFFFLGIFLAALTYHLCIQPFPDFIFFINELRQLLSANNTVSDGHNISSYGNDIFMVFLRILEFTLIGFSLTFSYSQFKKGNRNNGIAILLFTTIFLCVDYLFSKNFFGVNTYKYADALLLLTTVSFSFYLTNIVLSGFKLRAQFLLFCAILFISPLISAFGSNNGLLVNAVFSIPFWSILILFFAFKKNKHIYYTVTTLFSLVLLYQVLLKYVVQPYRLQPLIFQTETISPKIKRAKGLLVDLETKNKIEFAHKVLQANNFKAGDPIIALYRLPGLVYLLEGISPGGILWNPKQINMFLKNLEYSKYNIHESFIITSSQIDKEKLDKFHISINKSHVKIGSYDNYTIYRPNLIELAR